MPSLNDVLIDLREVRPVVAEVLEERTRQIIEEGYGPDHDDEWAVGQLAMAAAAYAVHPMVAFVFGTEHDPDRNSVHFEDVYPWLPRYDKREKLMRRRLLVQAAALIVAEIERIDRTVPSNRKPDLFRGRAHRRDC